MEEGSISYKDCNKKMNKFPTIESIETFFSQFMDIRSYISEKIKCGYGLERIKMKLSVLMSLNMRADVFFYKPQYVESIQDYSLYTGDLEAMEMSDSWREFMKYVEEIYNDERDIEGR